MNTTDQIKRLVKAAKEWAQYQEADSLLDQESDPKLRNQATAARETLLAAIKEL